MAGMLNGFWFRMSGGHPRFYLPSHPGPSTVLKNLLFSVQVPVLHILVQPILSNDILISEHVLFYSVSVSVLKMGGL